MVVKEKIVIEGTFETLYESDSLITIEIKTILESYYGNYNDTIYECLMFNPKVKFEMNNFFLPYLKERFDRSKIRPYLNGLKLNKDRVINMLAYEKDSKYSITYGLTDKDLILYVGDEGEFRGFKKVIIPLNTISKN